MPVNKVLAIGSPDRISMTTASLPLPPDEYKQVVESFAQAVWETDAAGQVVVDSPSWRAYTGQSLTECLGEGWVGAIHPDDQAYALHQWQEAIRQRIPVDAEFRLRSPDGDWRWTNARAVHMLDADGAVKKWVGLNIDIDDKKKAEQALQQQQARQTAELVSNQQLHQATLDSTLELIQVFEAVRDEQGQIVDFAWQLNNKAAGHYYGDVIGQRLLVHNPGVVETGIFDTFKRVVETGISDQTERYYVHEQFNGWFYQSTVKLNDGVATTTTDITQLKKAETQIRSGHALLQSVIDSSLDIIQVFKAVPDDRGQLIDFVWVMNNRKAIEQNGAVIGKRLLVHNPGVIQTGIFDHMVEVARTGVAYEHEQYYAHEQFADWFYQAIVKTDDGVAMTTRNITQQKQAEQQILRLKDEKTQQATDKYQALFESIDQGFNIIELIFDDNGHVIDYWQREHNPMFARITGLTDAIGKRMSELVPYVEPAWYQIVEAIYYTGEPIRVDHPVQALGQWFSAYMSRVGGEGSPLIACVYDDITERKQREANQQLLIDIGKDLGQLSNEEEIIRHVGTRLATQLSITSYYYVDIDEDRDEATVRHFWHALVVPPILGTYPLRAFVPSGALAAWRAGKPTVIRDMEREVPDGTPEAAGLKAGAAAQQISACIAVGLSQEGKWKAYFTVADSRPRAWTAVEIELVQAVAGQLLPRIERARAEEALRVSQKNFESIANLVPDLLWDSQPDGATNWYNQRWLEYTGQRFDEAIGWGWVEAIHPDDRAASARRYAEAVNTGQPSRYEHRIRRYDGLYRWFVVSTSPLKDQTGRVVKMYGAAIDIHEFKRLEATLLKADRRKDEFLAMLAHELRNPMAIIRNGLTILDLTITDELTRSTVGMMNRQTDHLVRMVDELLDVSRISQGKIELKLERVNLVELMQQAVSSLQPLFIQQGKTLHVDLPTAPVELLGDATRLTQVVTNLLTNGLRYTGDGGMVWLQLRLQSGPEDRMQALIQVRDNGIGLAPDQLSSIFELFVQVDNSLARSKGGLGLGLTLVRRLVAMHGGWVTAQSDGLGQGSAFTVQLPALTAIETNSTARIPDIPTNVDTLRILVIDDNPDATMTLGMLLTLKGYETHTRTSGQAGVEAAKQLRPSVILLDIGMPGLDGYETCRLIREQPWGQRITVIALTGYGQEEDRQRTRDAGFDGHLVKPVDLEALINVLATHH